jgi:hypothetical protein
MADTQELLNQLISTQHNNEDGMHFQFKGVSQQYVLTEYCPHRALSCTIRSFVTTFYPDHPLDLAAITIGYGVLENREPLSITWSTLAEVGEKTFQEVFGPIQISETQKHLLVCNLFSQKLFHSEIFGLQRRLADMQSVIKWTPP